MELLKSQKYASRKPYEIGDVSIEAETGKITPEFANLIKGFAYSCGFGKVKHIEGQ